MTDAGTSQPTMTPPTTQPYKLMRARKGRMLAGVAAGLAKSAGLDVTITRILLIASMFSGLGIVGYIALWIVLPEEQPSRGRVVEEAPENTARTIRTVLFVAALLGLLKQVGVFWPFTGTHVHSDFGFDGILGLILLSVGVGVLFSRHRPDRNWWEAPHNPPPTVTVETPVATPVPADGDAQPSDGPDDAVTYVGPTRHIAAPVHTAITEAIDQARNKDETATMGAITADEPRRGGAGLGWARAFGWFVLLWWTAGAIGVFGLWRYDAVTIAAPVLTFVAAWLAFTAVLNALIRVRNPSAIVATLLVLLVPVTIGWISTRADGPVGSRTERPVEHVHSSYKQAIGSLTLDFSDSQFAANRTTNVHAKIGTGALFVTVPDDVAVNVDADIRTGGYIVLGKQTNAGFSQSETFRFEGCPGAPTVHLTLRGGAGWMEVKRVSGNELATCPTAA